MTASRPQRIVIGVGNPGAEYTGTRHNLGFEVVELAARQFGLKLGRPFGSFWKVGKSRWAVGRSEETSFLLLEPLTYVNCIGPAVAKAVAWCGCQVDSIFVICDDLNIPPGHIRIRAGGSDGGHKGLRSVGAALKTVDFPRLRLGIGPPTGDVTGHVLGRFLPEEVPLINIMVEQAAAALAGFVAGLPMNDLMNRYNVRK